MLLVLTFLASADEGFVSAGPYRVQVTVTPETPRVGPNQVTVLLQDSQGKPVTGARLKVEAVMPAMGAMPAMFAPAKMVETAPGRYQGEFRPSMAGEWPLTVEIAGSAGKARLTFDLATGRRGIRCSSCGGGGAETSTVTIRVDPARRQLIGIRTAVVERRPLIVEIRAPGHVRYDPSHIIEVAPKFGGWVETLKSDAIGRRVRRGETLLTVYSPQLISAQEEYLAARQSGGRLLKAARDRLRRWNLPTNWIRALEKRGRLQETVPVIAPSDAILISSPPSPGSAFKAGQTLLRLADPSRLWVEAEVYPPDFGLLRPGMAARVVLPDPPVREWQTQVDFIYPFLDDATRSGRVRLTLENPGRRLLPGSYVEVRLRADLGRRRVVPASAVLYSGTGRWVFVDLGDGRLQPRRIRAGHRNRDWIEVVAGLKSGERVVSSGTFLIAAESKLKAGVASW
ncbi:MAG: hypothetical protein AXA67_08685 [Methylothermaceae bacteria B42]|nr:MAG: hypothetical protein AXA67_08685 [Methylothermaceae bacteria B42]